MKHAIIGTAGHVDHGKTMLIKALTGTDTDRLAEEKKRGITIELGFACLDFCDGTQAGIIDVPGHEKFIRNMLAGAGGIDLAMLVVAADEGVMPQTVEHLDILSLLDIHDGLAVITKCDLADSNWIEMVREDVAAHVRGTFLEGKPIMEVSAYTGQGLPELMERLRLLVRQTAERNVRIPFRLPVDRVFSVEGFGTVVTGTLIEGAIREDDMVELVPAGLTAKARKLQVHGREVAAAYAGQRVAINLAGVKRSAVQRGDTAAMPGTLHMSRMLDVRLQNLRDSGRIIKDNMLVHLFHGARELLSKIALLDRTELLPGDCCYTQLRLTEPLAAKKGDRFVIRFYSPLETIGGGVILDEQARKHKRNDPDVLAALAVKEKGSDEQRLVQFIAEQELSMPDAAYLCEKLALDEESTKRELEDSVAAGRVLELIAGRYVAARVLDAAWDRCQKRLAAYHAANPLHSGMKQAELRQKLFPNLGIEISDAVLIELQREGKIKRAGDRYALSAFEVRFTKRQAAIRQELLQIYQQAGLDAPEIDEVFLRFPPSEKESCRQVLDSVITSGELILVSPQLTVHSDTYQWICEMLRVWFAAHDTLTLAEFRDALNTSRRNALMILESLDTHKLTKKIGDSRRAGSALVGPRAEEETL